MSKMLTLIHDGWAAARAFSRDGRNAKALHHLNRLLAQVDLPAEMAADAHRLAAEMHLESERFAAARRHLRAALAIQPGDAETHYLVGRTFEEDADGSDERASRWFGKAMTLAPTVVRYTCAFGRAAVRSDRVKRGVRYLRKAAATAPGDLAVLRVVVDGLLEAGKTEEARRTLTRARFLCHGQKELDQLDARTRFESARRRQRKTQDAGLAKDGGFVSLPFLRVVGGAVRRDQASRTRPHFTRLRFGQLDRG